MYAGYKHPVTYGWWILRVIRWCALMDRNIPIREHSCAFYASFRPSELVFAEINRDNGRNVSNQKRPVEVGLVHPQP